MFQLGALVTVLLVVTYECDAVCTGADSTTLTYDLNGIDPSNASSIMWFYYGLNGNVSATVAVAISATFIPGNTYGSRVNWQDTSSVNLILSQPTTADEGIYGCQIIFASNSINLENISLELTDGATPGNLPLSLTYDNSTKTLQCDIPGLTSLGDAVLAINGDDDQIQANGTSLPVTLRFTQEAQDKNFTCFLTGPGAECSDVASVGFVTVRGTSAYTSASWKTESSTPSATVVASNGQYENENSTFLGAVVGGIVGGIVGLAIIFVIVCMLCKRARKTKGGNGSKNRQYTASLD